MTSAATQLDPAMKNLWKTLGYVTGVGLAGLYLLNPTAGFIELLPDQLPIVGNLDEAAMTALLLGCLRGLKQLRTPAAQAVHP